MPSLAQLREATCLHDIAPRLARARDGLLAQWAAEAVERRRLADLTLHAEWLVAHRELQLIRAEATGRARYIVKRQEKLAWARANLKRLRDAA